ncbi:MAG: MFS transporter [Patescibacteria group bacterium]|nr:hypothetical protein [Patescibacteria group bacterium]
MKQILIWPTASTSQKKVLWYSLILFFICLADTLMAYVTPLVLNEYFGHMLVVGLVMSCSSVVGLSTDWLISRKLPNTNYRFFIKWLILIGVWFPIIFWIFPTLAVGYLVAMMVWGVYYEMINFASFDFVNRSVQPSEHAFTWSILDVFKAMALLSTPIVAGLLFEIDQNLVFLLSLACFGLASFIFSTNKSSEIQPLPKSQLSPQRSQSEEVQIWWQMLKKIWPIYIFFFSMIMLDAAIWVAGPMLSEQIRLFSQAGSFVIPAYVLPTLLAPVIISRFGKIFKRTRVIFLMAIIGAIVLGVGSFIVGVSAWIIPIILLASLFIAIDFPEVGGIFEDFYDRVDEFGNDLTGLRNSAVSLAYIFGPVSVGLLAEVLNYAHILTVFAGLLFVSGIIALLFTPNRIRMPKAKLVSIISYKNRHRTGSPLARG